MRYLCGLVLSGLVVGLIGCGSNSSKDKSPSANPGRAAKDKDRAGDRAKGDATFTDSAGGAKKSADKGPSPTTAVPVSKPAAVEAKAGSHRSAGKQAAAPPAGMLTAGSFDDNLNPDFFRAFTDRMAQHPQLARLPDRFRGRRLVILVKDDAGAPVGNAAVRVSGGKGPGIELTTRTDGRAVFLSSFDNYSAEGDLQVAVTPPGGGAVVKQTLPGNASRWEVNLPGAKSKLPRNLDLVLLIDTTGSMGDELDFIKSEVKAIVASVKSKFPDVSQRYGLVFYRDDGDEYVTRAFPFTPSIDDFRANLSAQKAAGGGDEPEALHRALEETVQLSWRDADTARVVFLLTDAPCHAQHIDRTMAALNTLRKRGVAVYPVACSGTSDPAEFILRAAGLLTGTQYLFLTDDSGVGNAHGEPHIPFYHVENLGNLMVRMIASELSGKQQPPEKKEILRTVGKPIN